MTKLFKWRRGKPIAESKPPPTLVYKTVYPYVLLRGNTLVLKTIPYGVSGPMTEWELSLAQARWLAEHLFDPEEGYPDGYPYLLNKTPEAVILDLQDTLRRLLQSKLVEGSDHV